MSVIKKEDRANKIITFCVFVIILTFFLHPKKDDLLLFEDFEEEISLKWLFLLLTQHYLFLFLPYTPLIKIVYQRCIFISHFNK